MDLSVVNHKDYFAKIGDDHKFTINKFGELANSLLKKKIVNKSNLSFYLFLIKFFFSNEIYCW